MTSLIKTPVQISISLIICLPSLPPVSWWYMRTVALHEQFGSYHRLVLLAAQPWHKLLVVLQQHKPSVQLGKLPLAVDWLLGTQSGPSSICFWIILSERLFSHLFKHVLKGEYIARQCKLSIIFSYCFKEQ